MLALESNRALNSLFGKLNFALLVSLILIIEIQDL